MDLEDLENNEENTVQSSQMVAKRHPFCPVILSAIDHIQKLEVENAGKMFASKRYRLLLFQGCPSFQDELKFKGPY